MKPIAPYRVTVYNKITGRPFADFYTNQVPAKGDHVTIFMDHREEDNPFDLWGHWLVDTVVWTIAHRASQAGFEIARQCEGDMAAAYCQAVEIHVWPAEGPHWTGTPKFVKALVPPDEDGESDE